MAAAWIVLLLALAPARGADDASLLQARLAAGKPGVISGYVALRNLNLKLLAKLEEKAAKAEAEEAEASGSGAVLRSDEAQAQFPFNPFQSVQQMKSAAKGGVTLCIRGLDQQAEDQAEGIEKFRRVNGAFRAAAGSREGLVIDEADEATLRRCLPLLEDVIYEHELAWNSTSEHGMKNARDLREYYTSGPGHIIKEAADMVLESFSEDKLTELNEKFNGPMTRVDAIFAKNVTSVEGLRDQFRQIRDQVIIVRNSINADYEQMFADEASGAWSRQLAMARMGIAVTFGKEVADLTVEMSNKILSVGHTVMDVTNELASLLH